MIFDLSLFGAKARFQAQIRNQKSSIGNHQSFLGLRRSLARVDEGFWGLYTSLWFRRSDRPPSGQDKTVESRTSRVS